jgi:hypothetical protein
MSMSRSGRLTLVAVLFTVLVAAGCAPSAPGTWAAAGCYNSPSVDAPDVRFNGVANAKGNLSVSLDIATFTLSTDGTCSGVPLGDPYTLTLVRGAGETTAAATCTSLGLDNGVGPARTEYPGFPADAWICNPPPATT